MRRTFPVLLSIVLFLLGTLAICSVAVYQRYSVSHSDTRIVRLDKLTGAIAVYDQTGKMVNQRPEINVYDIIKHDVDLYAFYDTVVCGANNIAIKMQNGSEYDVLYATFKVDARKKGESSTLLVPEKKDFTILMQQYKENSYWWDDIVNKGKSLTLCYAMPKINDKNIKPAEIDFSVYDVMFTFDGVNSVFSDQDTLNRFKKY